MFISQMCGWTEDMWGALIGLFSFIPNWGWMIIVFTVCLKIVLSPLDLWQKKVARASAQKQAIIQPEVAKLQKKFGNNKQMLNQKTMELYKRENFSVFGSCIGMLVNMAVTLFIFLTLFYALIGLGQTQIYNQYETLQTDYNERFVVAFNLTDESEISATEQSYWDTAYASAVTYIETEEPQAEGESDSDYEKRIYNKALQNYSDTATLSSEYATIGDIQTEVLNVYNTEVKQSWLWVQNIWRPDTNSTGFPDYATFVSSTNLYSSTDYTTELNARITALGESATAEQISAETLEVQDEFENKYNFVTYNVQSAYQGWNGYFILTILAAAITYLSVTISQMQTTKKKSKKTDIQPQGAETPVNPINTNKAMKFMKFLLPILMIIFTIGYNAAFALYIVTNSVMSTILSFTFLKILDAKDKKKKVTITTLNKPDYSR